MTDPAKIDTTIYIGDIAIHQPVTTFTDYIITLLCFYFYLQLKRVSHPSISINHWKHFFLLLSFATLMGGCSHGFFAIHEGFGYKSFWLTMQLLNILSVYKAQQATLHSVLKDSEKKQYWNISYHIQLILFSIAVFIFHNFTVVVIDAAIGLIPLMVIYFIDAKKVKASAWIAWGIVVLLFTAVINGTKFSINEYFTYLDIGHVMIMINLSFMFIGIKRTHLQNIAL